MCKFCVTQPTKSVNKDKSIFEAMFTAMLDIIASENKSKKEVKKPFHNEEDGSFLISVDTYYAKRYLIPRLIRVAKSSNLTVDDLTKVRVGDTITVGVGERFDVSWAPTSSDEEGRPNGVGRKTARQMVENGEGPIHNLSETFEKISKALTEMGEAKTLMLELRGLEILSGMRPLIPTFAALLAEKIGRQNRDEKKAERKVLVNKDNNKGCVTIDTDDGKHTLITQQFVKVGYKIIPIGRNNTVVVSV